MAGTKQPIVFISYSHLDEPDQFLQPGETRWLSYVSSHLKPADAQGKLELWDDRRIDGGGDWRAEIDDALNRCAVCLFLVSRHSLSSRFILDVEMKRMLERHHAGGAHLYPIVITSVDLGAAPWLLKLNLKPSNGTALELYGIGPRNKVMSDLAAEIREIIQRTAAVIATERAKPDRETVMNRDVLTPYLDSVAKSVTADIYSGIKRWFSTLDPAGSKLKDYHSGLVSAFGFIQIMGMPAARKLQNVYVSLRAMPNLKKYTHNIPVYNPKPIRTIVSARRFHLH